MDFTQILEIIFKLIVVFISTYMSYISYIHFSIKNRETNILNQINFRNNFIKNATEKDILYFCEIYNINIHELKEKDINIQLFIFIINEISLFQLYQKNKYKHFMFKNNKVDFSRFRKIFFKNQKVKYIWKEYYITNFHQKIAEDNFTREINKLIK